ncbi:MAG: hypothetical protein ACD_50C00065G0009 [uncultured bacterium]|nr:MAG: hypothetical protein ACD_50C00065G0009 [uncultured bacterium]OGH13087.1 MAG: hypothetical protein A2687_00295 [Candidatus Levybacteria bacterium RIFCSPHIGHO2_01_FULL_38_26]
MIERNASISSNGHIEYPLVVEPLLYAKCERLLGEGKLPIEQVRQVADVVWHRVKDRNEEYIDPKVERGITILQSHLGIVLNLGRDATFRSILERTRKVRYFDGLNPEDVEAQAFGLVSVYDMRANGQDRSQRIHVDYSGLVNPNWRPPKS